MSDDPNNDVVERLREVAITDEVVRGRPGLMSEVLELVDWQSTEIGRLNGLLTDTIGDLESIDDERNECLAFIDCHRERWEESSVDGAQPSETDAILWSVLPVAAPSPDPKDGEQ